MSEPLPIEFRPGQFILIHGIPQDLTVAEARKIAGVVLAMVPGDLRVVEVKMIEPQPLVFEEPPQ